MMASPASVVSQTLQSITITKIQELQKQHQLYEQRKKQILSSADNEAKDLQEKVSRLHAGVKELDVWSRDELENIRRWLHQSTYDPSVPDKMLMKFEKDLRSRLDIESRKLELADLYSRLLMEWIESPNTGDAEFSMLESTSLDGSFEVVQTVQKERLQQLREKFEQVVFEPLETSETEIYNYLHSLFKEDSGERAFKRLRESVSMTGKDMLAEKQPFNRQNLKWCIKALLKNDLLNDEKKTSLREFLQDEAVLNEIRDVLNMRYADLQNWSWSLGTEGIPVIPRQSLNGKWRVMMDEDVLQALLTHWIGTRWAVSLKETLRAVIKYTGIWAQQTRLPYEENAKRKYYLDESSANYKSNSVEHGRQKTYRHVFFMAPLPSKVFEDAGGYDDDDDVPEVDPDRKSPKEIKQLLLRTLATEVHVRRSLDGEVAVVQSDFQWFATGLAHSTIFAVLRFMGFQEEWVTFFKKSLEPPLNMLTGEPVKIRKRGLPMAHIFEKLLGELVLFFMDLAVNQEAGMLLYRIHDDLWLCDKPQKCAKAWQTMERFAAIMGLEFNKNKTGSVYLVDGNRGKKADIVKVLPEGPVFMNFLILDPSSGQWIINEEHVQQHVKQLQKQLAGSKSVLEWVSTWNSCVGRFFSYTFGEPANCFGRSHLDKILETQKKVQAFLFDGRNENGRSVTEHLVGVITRRFNVSNVPDAFLFLPQALGGLGLHNPFIPLSLVYGNLCADPEARMRKFHEEEQRAYNEAKKEFEALTDHERRRRYLASFPKDEEMHQNFTWEEAQRFLTFEQYTKWCECVSPPLHAAFNELMSRPYEQGIADSHEVRRALRKLAGAPHYMEDMDPRNVSSDMMWNIQYYADELFEKYGGLSIVDRTLLPLGVLKAMSSRKVTWQMVL